MTIDTEYVERRIAEFEMELNAVVHAMGGKAFKIPEAVKQSVLSAAGAGKISIDDFLAELQQRIEPKLKLHVARQLTGLIKP
jgi:hypothetical protein